MTIYHMVIEGTLGLTTSQFMLDYLASTRVCCPASRRATG